MVRTSSKPVIISFRFGLSSAFRPWASTGVCLAALPAIHLHEPNTAVIQIDRPRRMRDVHSPNSANGRAYRARETAHFAVGAPAHISCAAAAPRVLDQLLSCAAIDAAKPKTTRIRGHRPGALEPAPLRRLSGYCPQKAAVAATRPDSGCIAPFHRLRSSGKRRFHRGNRRMS